MTHTTEMLETNPRQTVFDRDALARCIEACFDCAQACAACSDACLGEETVAELTRCITLNEVCAGVCATTGAALSRQGADQQVLLGLLEACERACAACAEECERHAEMHEHCRICAGACRQCAQRCRELLAG